jgi:antitoxin (DNA-binding transcriptional repressor) of toxin-antitoxin stability system
MSTLRLEKLPESVETLATLIREGQTIRLTDKGRVIATVAPTSVPKSRRSATRSAAPKMSIAEFIKTHLDGRKPRPDRDFTALLRAERDRE